MNDSVNRPAHYTDGKIEVIDFIEDKKLNFHRGNAVKYIARAGKKDPTKETEDLEKAIWYLRREIQRLGGEAGKLLTQREVIQIMQLFTAQLCESMKYAGGTLDSDQLAAELRKFIELGVI